MTVTTTTNNTTNNYHLVSDTAAPALSPTHRKIDLDAFVVTDGPIVTYTIRDKLRVYKTKKADAKGPYFHRSVSPGMTHLTGSTQPQRRRTCRRCETTGQPRAAQASASKRRRVTVVSVDAVDDTCINGKRRGPGWVLGRTPHT